MVLFLLGSQAYRVLTFFHLIGLLSLEFFFSSSAVQPQALKRPSTQMNINTHAGLNVTATDVCVYTQTHSV